MSQNILSAENPLGMHHKEEYSGTCCVMYHKPELGYFWATDSRVSSLKSHRDFCSKYIVYGSFLICRAGKLSILEEIFTLTQSHWEALTSTRDRENPELFAKLLKYYMGAVRKRNRLKKEETRLNELTKKYPTIVARYLFSRQELEPEKSFRRLTVFSTCSYEGVFSYPNTYIVRDGPDFENKSQRLVIIGSGKQFIGAYTNTEEWDNLNVLGIRRKLIVALCTAINNDPSCGGLIEVNHIMATQGNEFREFINPEDFYASFCYDDDLEHIKVNVVEYNEEIEVMVGLKVPKPSSRITNAFRLCYTPRPVVRVNEGVKRYLFSPITDPDQDKTLHTETDYYNFYRRCTGQVIGPLTKEAYSDFASVLYWDNDK